MFAEHGLRPLFKGLLRLVTKHQSQARTIRLRNEWVTMDPRQWDASMDVRTNVALGQGPAEERVAALAAQLEQQMALMQAGAPFVTWAHIRATLARMVELGGYPDSSEFYAQWTPEQDAQMAQQRAQEPPPPDANLIIAEAEKIKATSKAVLDSARLELDKARLEFDRWRATLEDDRMRDKAAIDAMLEDKKLDQSFQASRDQLDDDVEDEAA